MGIFGRSESAEKEHFSAAYNKWFESMHRAECLNRGTSALTMEVLRQIHQTALNQAANETYRQGQIIRVSDQDAETLFMERLQVIMSENIKRSKEQVRKQQ